jgi:acyl carrier protein
VADDAKLRAAVLDALLEVAPDIDAHALDPARPLREQFDFDSMDLLNFALALHARFGVDVPETDYARLASLDGSVDYIARTRSG